jgi:hypothetical protein
MTWTPRCSRSCNSQGESVQYQTSAWRGRDRLGLLAALSLTLSPCRKRRQNLGIIDIAEEMVCADCESTCLQTGKNIGGSVRP